METIRVELKHTISLIGGSKVAGKRGNEEVWANSEEYIIDNIYVV